MNETKTKKTINTFARLVDVCDKAESKRLDAAKARERAIDALNKIIAKNNKEENKVVENYIGKPSTRKRRGTNRRGGVGRGEENKETAEDETENKNNKPETDL